MARINSPTQLEAVRTELRNKTSADKVRITLCSGTACEASESTRLGQSFEVELKRSGLADKVILKKTGCHGFCEQGPLVTILPMDICYVKVRPEDVGEVIAHTVVGNNIIDRLLYVDPVSKAKIIKESEIPFYKYQRRLILGNNGKLDPKSIEDYIVLGG